jgi:hypothetical protein
MGGLLRLVVIAKSSPTFGEKILRECPFGPGLQKAAQAYLKELN